VENISDWSLDEFRKHYEDTEISKWDVFYYAYGVLHSPEYRDQFAANLRKHLPRIPMAESFSRLRDAGKTLADLHVGYENLEPYPLVFEATRGMDVSYLIDQKMKLQPETGEIVINETLTLSGIPESAHRYKLGNRSALEWLVSQFFVDDDNPNREEDEEYIVRLLGQIVRISVETVRITEGLEL
jgi:predicted helicase